MASLGDLWGPVTLTLMLAGLTTAILFVLGTPIAWWLAHSEAKWKEMVAAIVALPLVLPPTVLGFYLLIGLGPSGPGGWLAGLWGARTLAFSFAGLVIGSVIYSLPFMVQPLRAAFEGIGEEPIEAARTLGASNWQSFVRVAAPLARAGFMGGGLLSFAHTVGEFGAVLMIGGNIPGETRVLSIAIYQFVEKLEWGKAHVLAAGLAGFALVVVMAATLVEKGWRARSE